MKGPTIARIIIGLVLTLCTVVDAHDEPPTPENAIQSITVKRSAANPLITAQSSPTLGTNINGPSVIRVPDWVKNPLGKYYMYFGHHKGKFIRLAYADKLEGPWTIHEPGTLQLEEAKYFGHHIASPDVHVDDEKKQIIMYFHGPSVPGKQRTGVAVSTDGLAFKAFERVLGKFYFRVFPWKGKVYAIAKNFNTGWGELYRANSWLDGFDSRGNFVSMLRHCAVQIRGNQLLVFYSRKGDAPERIVVITVDISGDWTTWKESAPMEVIQPEKEYEGIQYKNKPSNYGAATKVRQLRDPCIFEEEGKTYLFYTIAGEMGIAMAELEIRMKEEKQ
ncbi:MAG: glycoside hydrolase family protein [Planctomycetota bacterium]|jgi:hypothetical protein